MLEILTDPVALRDSFTHVTPHATQESIGEHLRTRQNFISLEATGTCHMVLQNGNLDLCHSLVHRTWTKLRRNKEQFIRNLVGEIKGYLVNDLCPAYQAQGKLQSNRWTDGFTQIVFEKLLQVDSPAVSLDASCDAILVLDSPISEELPLLRLGM